MILFSTSKLSIGLSFFGALLLFLISGRHAESKVHWSQVIHRSNLDADFNHSHLSNIHSKPSETIEILDQPRQLQLRQDLDDLNRQYDMRRKFNISNLDEISDHTRKLSEFSKDLFTSIRRHQIEKGKRKIRPLIDALKSQEWVKVVGAPVGVAALAAFFYLGNPLNFNLTDQTRIFAQANFTYRKLQLGFYSPYITWTFDWLASAPIVRAGNEMVPLNPMERADERYRVSFSRLLPWGELYTGLYYMSTSRILEASISRAIFFPNLHCLVGSYYPTDPANSDVKDIGEEIKLSYIIRL